jgi:hypothetical protein
MKSKLTLLVGAIVIGLFGCVAPSIHVSPESTLRKGATVQIARMSSDPLGGVAKLTIAMEKRGFIVLDGDVGATVTNNTKSGTQTFRPTSATHYLTFTYTTRGDGNATCRLVNINTRRADVLVDLAVLPVNAADICAEAILKAAK